VAETAEIFRHPRHPYTRALIDSIPRMSAQSVNDPFEVEGEPPSPYDVPDGCRFHPRCALAGDICRQNDPPLLQVGRAQAAPHLSACLKADELAHIPLPEAPVPETPLPDDILADAAEEHA
jgi:oligopeptide/dipeptide ABC transporter ATP-binding protein